MPKEILDLRVSNLFPQMYSPSKEMMPLSTHLLNEKLEVRFNSSLFITDQNYNGPFCHTHPLLPIPASNPSLSISHTLFSGWWRQSPTSVSAHCIAGWPHYFFSIVIFQIYFIKSSPSAFPLWICDVLMTEWFSFTISSYIWNKNQIPYNIHSL